MADSINVTAPLINADGGDGDLQPLAQNLTPEDRKTAKTPRTSDSHGDEPMRKRRSTDSSPVRTPEKEITDDESVGDVGSSHGTRDAFHQQAGAEESQSGIQRKREWLCDIIKRVDADTIAIKQTLLKLQKKTLKERRGESVDDVGSSSGTSDRDDPDAFHQQAEAEESQSEGHMNKERLREIIYGLGAEKISFIFSKLEESRLILPQIKKLKDESVDDEASSSGTSDGDDPDAEAEKSQSEDQSKRECLLRIIDRMLTEDISQSHLLSKCEETRATSDQFCMEIKRKLKGFSDSQLEALRDFDFPLLTVPLINADGGDVDLQPAAEEEEEEEEEEMQSEDDGNAAQNYIRKQFHKLNQKHRAQFDEIHRLIKLRELGVTLPFILLEIIGLSSLKIQQCVDTLVCELK